MAVGREFYVYRFGRPRLDGQRPGGQAEGQTDRRTGGQMSGERLFFETQVQMSIAKMDNAFEEWQQTMFLNHMSTQV